MSDSKKHKMKRTTLTITYSVKAVGTPYRQLRKTRKDRRNKIDDFMNCLLGFCFFPHYIRLFYPLKAILTRPELLKLYMKKGETAFRDDLMFLISRNEVMSPTMDACVKELMIFLYELQVCGYSGAARTLRYVLETAIEACDFQTEVNRPTFEVICKEHTAISKLPKKERKLNLLLVKHNAWASLIERYRIYEKIKRIAPSFNELVNSLNSRQVFQEAPKVSEELKRTYETLSDYVHPSLGKFEEATAAEYKPLTLDFNSNEFDIVYELGLRTFDLIQFLYLKSMALFFGFKNVNEFLKDLAEVISFESKKELSFLMLPYSKQVSKGINWRISKQDEKRKKNVRKQI